MPLSTDNLIQSNSGTFTGTSGSAALAGANVTEAGTTVVLAVYSVGTTVAVTTPTGFKLAQSFLSAPSSLYVFYRYQAGGESSWTVAQSVSQLLTWMVLEYSGIDPNSAVIGTPITSTTDTLNSIYGVGTGDDLLALGFRGVYQTGATAPTITASDTGQTASPPYTAASAIVTTGSGADATNSATLGAAAEFPPSLTASYIATIIMPSSPSFPTGTRAIGVAFRAKGNAFYPTLTHVLGAQHGTSAGWTTGTAGFTYLASASAGVSVTSTNPRHDTYAFRCNATTLACNFTDKAVTVPAGVFVGRLSFRLNATPAANLELGGVATGLVTFRWVQATGTIGCKVASGTEQVSTSTVASAAWWTIDYRLDTSGTTWACEWTLTPDSTLTAETETTATGAGVATTSFTPRAGWTTATTGDVNFADVVCSSTSAAYPLGNYQVRVMKINGARSALTPATPANWKLFTANGTLATWADATAAATMDELPATIGAAADGLTQITVDTGMTGVYFETLDLGVTASAKGARCCAVGWAAAAAVATISARIQMGGAVDSIYAPVADYTFTTSTTAPAWLCSGVLGSGAAATRMTRALLTNNVGSTFPGLFMFGASNDATPDIGFHAAYLELAVKIAATVTLQRGPDGNATATLYQDADTSGYIGLQFTAPADRGMTYSYEFPSGTTVGPTALAAGVSSALIALDASVLTSVPRVNCTLDAAP